MALLLACISMVSCGSISQAKTMVAGLYEKYQVVEGKLSDVQDEMAAAQVKAEELHGALDSDGDGKVSLAERTSMVKGIVAGAAMGSEEDKDLLKNPYLWALLGLGGASGSIVRRVKKAVINPKDTAA